MRKFKPNVVTTFLFAMVDILLPLSLGIPLMLLLMGKNCSFVDMLCMGLTMVAIAVLWNLFCGMLYLLTWPFSRYKVFLDEECFYYEGGIRVYYHDVTEIVFDTGSVGKGGGNEPCCLDCYKGDKMLFSVNYPSLVMTVMLIKNANTPKCVIDALSRCWVRLPLESRYPWCWACTAALPDNVLFP